MTNPTPHGQVPEALRLAFDLEQRWNDNMTCAELDAAAELRRQHARIAELEQAARQALEALSDCVDDSRTVLSQNEQIYTERYRPHVLIEQERVVKDAETAIAALHEALSGVQALSAAPAVPTSVKGAMWFTKKPVTIQAIQWTGENLREVITFTDGPPDTRSHHAGMAWDAYRDLVARDGLKIYTLEGKMLASPGDWIIRGVKGEMYPCKDEIFRLTYEPVGEVVSASCDHATVRWLHQTSSVGGGDPRNSRAWPKVSGVSRDEGHSRALLVFFAAEPTDDEMRAVHDTLAASPTPPAEQQAAPKAAPKAAPVVWLSSKQLRGVTALHGQYLPFRRQPEGRFDTPVYLEQAAPKAAPVEQDDHQILAITTAYEQGVGKGHQAYNSGKEIANPYSPAYRCDLAWQYGYKEGKEQAQRATKAAPQQEAQEPATVPYQKLTDETDLILSDPDTELSIGAKRALLWVRTWVSVPLWTTPQPAPVVGRMSPSKEWLETRLAIADDSDVQAGVPSKNARPCDAPPGCDSHNCHGCDDFKHPSPTPQPAPDCHHRPPCDECAALAAQGGE